MKRFYNLFGVKEDSTVFISSKKTFLQKLKIERSRAHRNGHVFSVVVFDLNALQLKNKNAGRIINVINRQVHDYDHIGWYGRKKIGVILPYTSAKEAKDFSNKINDSFNNIPQEWKYTLISYPPKKNQLKKNKMNISEQLNTEPLRKVV